MKLNIYYESGGTAWCHCMAFNETYDLLLETFPEIEFNFVDSVSLRLPETYMGPGSKFGPHFMIIENDETKKYFIISYWDKIGDLKKTNWDLENCVEVFTSSGVHFDDFYYKSLGIEYTPISYVTTTMDNQRLIEELYNNKPPFEKQTMYDKVKKTLKVGKPKNTTGRIYPDKLMFRGYLYLFRRYLESDNRFNVLSTQLEGNYLDAGNYIRELDKYNLNLSLNGAGEICFRDIEILGLGTALIRPKLVTKFHNELIPDYHYISVDFSSVEWNILDYPDPLYWIKLSNKLHERFMEVKDDWDFINYVAENGRKWYTENGTTKANAKIIVSLLDFKKLL